jgi:hypothetical protein
MKHYLLQKLLISTDSNMRFGGVANRSLNMNAELLCQVAFEHEKRVEAETELGIAP